MNRRNTTGIIWLLLVLLTMYLLLTANGTIRAVEVALVAWVGGVVSVIVYRDIKENR